MPATIDALDELAKPEHRQDPYPFLHWLRENDPVHRTRCGFYLLSNYDDVAFALRQDTAFTAPDEAATWAEIGHGKRSHPAVRKLVAAFTAKHHPCYARLRAVIAGDMTPSRVLRLRPRILEHLGNVFDDIGPRLVAGETVDLHAEVSVPLTQHVFADRIGLPEEDRSWIADTIALMTRALGTDEVALEADLASNAVEDYFRARLAERKASPRDDLISRLVEAHDGEDLLIAILWIMWMTGYESTISGIDRAVQAFLAHPEQRSWCDDDQSRVQRFIDETLRHDGVVLYTPIPRIAQEEVALGGGTIPAGAPVRMVIAGANRDPRVFRDPDTFDPARDPRRMLSTGNCCGTALGRAEMAHVAGADEARSWLRSEYANLIAAITFAAESGNTELAARLPLALMSFFEFDSRFDDGVAMYRIGLDAAASAGDVRAEAVLCNNLGILHSVRRDYDEGERWFQRSLPLWQAISDEYGEGQALINLAGVHVGRGTGDAAAAAQHLLRALEIFTRLDHQLGRVFAMTHLTTVYKRMKRLDEALAAGTEAAATARELGAEVIEAATLSDLGRLHEDLGDFPAALACHESALEIHCRLNNQLREARDRLCVAYVCRELGQYERMRQEHTRAFAMLEELNPAEVERERAAFGPLPS